MTCNCEPWDYCPECKPQMYLADSTPKPTEDHKREANPNKSAIEAVEQCRKIIYDATHPGDAQSEAVWINAKARIYHLLRELKANHEQL